MKLGSAGLALLKLFEGCRLTAYQDQNGIWTIGYGHTGPEVVEGLVWTQEQADAQLALDASWAATAVMKSLDVMVNQNEFDALTCFTYNVGSGNEAHSTLLRLLNAGNRSGAADEFLKWDHVRQGVSAGLERRCEAERALFLAPVAAAA